MVMLRSGSGHERAIRTLYCQARSPAVPRAPWRGIALDRWAVLLL